MITLTAKNLSVVLGDKRQEKKVLNLADKGYSRQEIKEQTGAILGVHNCDLTVQEGEILVVMGLSGSGKSTFLRSIAQLIPPSRGEVILKNNNYCYNLCDISAQKLRQVRTHLISMVFQQFSLLPWRTVAGNISLGLEIAGIRKKKRLELINQQLELIRLSEYKDVLVSELSGGMQQRVGLARALATGAPILLMDEPFSALDPLIRSSLQDELKSLQEKLCKTIIFVSHDLEEAVKLGTRILIMKDGHVIQCDTPANIVFNPVDTYVRNFSRNLNPLSILSAKDIMTPINQTSPAQNSFSAQVAPETPIREILLLVKSENDIIAVSQRNNLLGTISTLNILNCLKKATN